MVNGRKSENGEGKRVSRYMQLSVLNFYAIYTWLMMFMMLCVFMTNALPIYIYI